ncbi:MAG: SH3 domain-containing protein [Atopobiaceae bacterium]|nr:SH3 domain-containing protein [Atopobiaceae bacterium]
MKEHLKNSDLVGNRTSSLRLIHKLLLALSAVLLLFCIAPSRAFAGETYTVKVDKGYLALRTAPSYDEANEIGELYTGDTVEVKDRSNGQYWWVYSPKHGREGYVNKDYLRAQSSTPAPSRANSYGTYSVKVDKGYLALRTAPSYDEANEIGELYTGDTVEVLDKSNGQYWWVYSPKHGREGYVNKDYLRGTSSSSSWAPGVRTKTYGTYTVKVDKGYLALRTAPSYDDANEIGQLNTGDTVQVLDKSNGQYWWVYSPKHGREGYVNADYLRGGSSTSAPSSTPSQGTYTVRVATGYLALRTAPSYDEANEIGELHTGEKVQVKDKSNGQYWWVYAPTLGKEGYVNADYLV